VTLGNFAAPFIAFAAAGGAGYSAPESLAEGSGLANATVGSVTPRTDEWFRIDSPSALTPDRPGNHQDAYQKVGNESEDY
jgi:hypothetical protein